jgi:hypothetical protein
MVSSHTADQGAVDLIVTGDSWAPTYSGNGETQEILQLMVDFAGLQNPLSVTSQNAQDLISSQIAGFKNYGLYGTIVAANVIPTIARGHQYHNIMKLRRTAQWMCSDGRAKRNNISGDLVSYILQPITNAAAVGPDAGFPRTADGGTFALPTGPNASRGFTANGLLLDRMKAKYGVNPHQINRYDFELAGAAIYENGTTTFNTWIPDTPGPSAVPKATGYGYDIFRFRDVGQNLDPRFSANYHRDYELYWGLSQSQVKHASASSGLPYVDPLAETRLPWLDTTDGNQPIMHYKLVKNPPTGKLIIFIQGRGNDLFARMQENHQAFGPGHIITASASPASGSPVRIVNDIPHGIVNGQFLTVVGVTGNAGALPDATHAGYYAKIIDSVTFDLYNDYALTSPRVSTGTGSTGSDSHWVIGNSMPCVPFNQNFEGPAFWDSNATQAEAVKEYVDSIPLAPTPKRDGTGWEEFGFSGQIESEQRKLLETYWGWNPNAEIVMPSYANFALDEPDMGHIYVKRPKGGLPSPTRGWDDARGIHHPPYRSPLVRWTNSPTNTLTLQEPGQAAEFSALAGFKVWLIEYNPAGTVVHTQARAISSAIVGTNQIVLDANTNWNPVAGNTVEMNWRLTATTLNDWEQPADTVDGHNGVAFFTGSGFTYGHWKYTTPIHKDYLPPYYSPDTIPHVPFFPSFPVDPLTQSGEDEARQGTIEIPGWARSWWGINSQFSATWKTFGYGDYDRWMAHYLADKNFTDGVVDVAPGSGFTHWNNIAYTYKINNPLDKKFSFSLTYPGGLLAATGATMAISVSPGTLPIAGSGLVPPTIWDQAYQNNIVTATGQGDKGINPGSFLPYVMRYMINAVTNRIFRDTIERSDLAIKDYYRANPHSALALNAGKYRYHAPQVWECHAEEAELAFSRDPRPELACKADSPWNSEGETRYRSGSRFCFIESVHMGREGSEIFVDAVIKEWLPESALMEDLLPKFIKPPQFVNRPDFGETWFGIPFLDLVTKEVAPSVFCSYAGNSIDILPIQEVAFSVYRQVVGEDEVTPVRGLQNIVGAVLTNVIDVEVPLGKRIRYILLEGPTVPVNFETATVRVEREIESIESRCGYTQVLRDLFSPIMDFTTEFCLGQISQTQYSTRAGVSSVLGRRSPAVAVDKSDTAKGTLIFIAQNEDELFILRDKFADPDPMLLQTISYNLGDEDGLLYFQPLNVTEKWLPDARVNKRVFEVEYVQVAPPPLTVIFRRDLTTYSELNAEFADYDSLLASGMSYGEALA